MDLWDAAGISSGSVVSVIGAGGKTTTIFNLAEQAAQRGLATLVTTTTKMRRPELPLVLEVDARSLDERLWLGFAETRQLAAGSAVSSAGKLLALGPDQVCSLRAPDVILCEADGAAGRSLKIHRPGEPVVPACTSHLVVVAGLDALGRPLAEASHPSGLSVSHFGAADGSLVEENHIAGALIEGAGYRPQSARLILVLNKADGLRQISAGRNIAGLALTETTGSTVLLTSHGRVLERIDPVSAGPPYTRP